MYKKYARKLGRNFRKNVVAPYTSKKKNRGYNNRMRLYKEVGALKKMINAEKQNADLVTTTLQPLAQLNGAATGAVCFDITPTVAQGISEDQRKGDSLKVCSWVYKCNVQTNSFNTLQDVKYKFYILRQPTNPIAAGGTAIAQFLEPNPFSGYQDYYSNRDYEHFKDWTVMGVISSGLKTNTNDSLNQYRSNTHVLARKQEFHIRYSKGTTTILNNPIYVLAVASEGDRSGTNLINFQQSMRIYYYDN